MLKRNVSVIIPSYNRSHVLDETVPTYIQDVTLEVIIVDDGSTDGTREKVREIHEKFHQVKYIRLKEHKGLPYAKNIGISKARGEYLYFGDDDAVLYEGSLHRLRDAIEEFPADIAGANGTYAEDMEQVKNFEQFIESHFRRPFDTNCMVDFNTGSFVYDYKFDTVKEGLFLMATFLIRAECAKDTRFDRGYIGNAAREDMDYLIRQAKKGRKMVYTPGAYEVDLPWSYVGGGGCHAMKPWKITMYNIRNTIYFMNRHYDWLKEQGYLSVSKGCAKRIFCSSVWNNYVRKYKEQFNKMLFGL